MTPREIILDDEMILKLLSSVIELEGVPGIDGKDGKDGKDGVDGTNGKNGLNGKDGKTGLRGQKGDSGEDGKDGVDGKNFVAIGPKGDTGNTGSQGTQGNQGIRGIQGIQGDPGPNAAWGNVTGTLSAQTDINSALGGKAANSHSHGPTDITGTAVVTADSRLTDARQLASGADKTKLDGIAAGAEVNVNADWNSGSGDSQIMNKPTTMAPTTHDNTAHSATYIVQANAVVPNTNITAATKTKVTYDVKGLVTAGADATTADIADSADKRYCTDAQKTALHPAVTVSAPISLSTQALSVVNDVAATITEVDTGTLGNVDTTIPTSKVVTTAIGVHAALKTGVHGLLNSVRVRPQVTPTAKTSAVTLTIAELLTGIITGNPAAAAAYTLPTGTLCEGGMTIAVDEAFEWTLINIATTAANIITLTAATGHTIVGSVQIPANSATTGGLWGTCGATFRTRKTATNTFITYRVG